MVRRLGPFQGTLGGSVPSRGIHGDDDMDVDSAAKFPVVDDDDDDDDDWCCGG